MQFTPFISNVEFPFYTSLASRKINHDMLDDSPRKLVGLYEIRPADTPEASCRLQIHGSALTQDVVPPGYYRAEGMIKNVNTIEEYRNIDKNKLLHQAGKTIWDSIVDGSIYSCPSLLASFFILCFADLKRYKFWYWFAFPAINSNPSWIVHGSSSTQGTQDHSRYLRSAESVSLVEAVEAWRSNVDVCQHGFFLAKMQKTTKEPTDNYKLEPRAQASSQSESDFSRWEVSSLSTFDEFFRGIDPEDCYVCFADPSNYHEAAGWVLRNLLAVARYYWKLDEVQILRYRDTPQKKNQGRSIIVKLKSNYSGERPDDTVLLNMPKITGWERNSSGKLAGRIIDLKEYMDPKRLADQSIDLNLKLMKWRISPNLNLEKIKETKCLLLGAGTLGSYVARNLLGWGVRKITFIDNSTVSFSNPVRQPLFKFEDCLSGKERKAQRAAKAIVEIYPGIECAGHDLSIPMLGHPIVDQEQTQKDFEVIKALFDQHDAVFILMDSRESRWLPTVMGKALDKIVMNAALGFDTFVAMRHGVKAFEDNESSLGCYFCNDVVAPGDSLRHRTLDQQCTVTRPGIAAIASAVLVELFVSVLQHPDGAKAPASLVMEDDPDHPLGIIPHQIRGFLSNFSNVVVTGHSYNHCSACSERILNAYEQGGWEFVEKALNHKGYIEELSGLKEVQQLAEEAAALIEEGDNLFDEGYV